MGTWGAGSFENDSVLDWLADVCSGRGFADVEEGEADVVREALAAVADAGEDEYLDADDAQPALAAAEIVAAARGKGDDRIADQDDLMAWLAGRRDAFTDADLDLARRAVERVLARSELQQLWDENGPDNEWRPVVKELLRRLAPNGAGAKRPIAARKPAATKKPAAKKKPAATKKPAPAKKLAATKKPAPAKKPARKAATRKTAKKS
jgi:Domain of unknown function (DUF4259)